MEDGRCRLGLAGRRELVRLMEDGATTRAAAAALGVAPATVHRWWSRWRAASEAAVLLVVLTRPGNTVSGPASSLRSLATHVQSSLTSRRYRPIECVTF
jgi:transposase-like protein